MPFKEFEAFHGAVLAKIVRSENPVALRLVETRTRQNWSTYTLNDKVDLVMSHSKAPRYNKSDGGSTSWTFPFSPNQMRQLNGTSNERPVWLALICGDENPQHICLLDPDQIAEILNFTAKHPSITVRKPDRRGKFRVFKGRREILPRISPSRLDRWEIPGS